MDHVAAPCTYDVYDRQIGKQINIDGNGTYDTAQRFVYDGDDLVLAFSGGATGSLTNRYLVGPHVDEILADETGSGIVTWSLTDNLGSVRDLVQYSAGTGTTSVVDHITYDTFGQIKGQTNSTWQPRFAYTGREWDADANLYQYCARWYDPRVGKFLSEDPLGFAAGDVNLSRYAGNTATVFVDPSGRFSGPPAGTPPTTTPADVTEQITKSNYRPRFIEQTPDLANDAAMQARMRIHHSLQQALADRYLAERGINVHDLVHLHGVDKTFHETVVNAMQRMFWEDMAKEYSKDGRVFTPTTVKAVVSLSGIDQCNQRLHDAFPGVFFRWGRPRR